LVPYDSSSRFFLLEHWRTDRPDKVTETTENNTHATSSAGGMDKYIDRRVELRFGLFSVSWLSWIIQLPPAVWLIYYSQKINAGRVNGIFIFTVQLFVLDIDSPCHTFVKPLWIHIGKVTRHIRLMQPRISGRFSLRYKYAMHFIIIGAACIACGTGSM